MDSEWLSALAQLAQAIARIGGHPLAEWAYGALLPHRRLFGVEGIGAACWGSVERPLGLLAASLGRTQEALEHFDSAVAANHAAGWPLYVAVTLRDAGLALGDQQRLAAALALFRELGVSRRVAELESRVATAPAPAHRRTSSTGRATCGRSGTQGGSCSSRTSRACATWPRWSLIPGGRWRPPTWPGRRAPWPRRG